MMRLFTVRNIALILLLTGFMNCGSSDSSNKVTLEAITPDYNVVFAQDEVKRMDIIIDPADWQIMQEELTFAFGEFGSQIPMPQFGGAVDACLDLNVDDPCFICLMGSAIYGTCGTNNQGQFRCIDFDFSAMGGLGDMLGGDSVCSGEFWAPCTVVFEGETWNAVGFRFKGFSSLIFSWLGGIYKLPFRLDFDQFEYVSPETTNQTFHGFKKLTFSSNYSDNSLIREKVVADMFRDFGVPAPMTAFYRVFIDHGDGPTYFGLYTMVEPPYYPMLKEQFGDDGGNLYKPKGGGADFVVFDEASFPKHTNVEEADWSDVIAVFEALHNGRNDADAWEIRLEDVFNVEGFLYYLAANNVMQNWDTYGNMAQNYYIYSNPQDGRVHWIPWDNNMALSNEGDTGPSIPGAPGGLGTPLSLDLSEVTDEWPLIRYLIDNPEYWEVYKSFVEDFVDTTFNNADTQRRYQEAHDLIAPYVVGPEGENPGYSHLPAPQDFYDELDSLFNHLQDRHDAVEAFLLP